MPSHKNKSIATLLAVSLGGLGAYRFYLRGMRDKWGWLHLATLPISSALLPLFHKEMAFFALLPLIISTLGGFLAALVLGLTSDEKWDAQFNPNSGKKSDSTWPLALLIVLAFGGGAIGLIATLARSFDLLMTGGAYG